MTHHIIQIILLFSEVYCFLSSTPWSFELYYKKVYFFALCSTSVKAWEANFWSSNWLQRIGLYQTWSLHLWAFWWAKYHTQNSHQAHWHNWRCNCITRRRYTLHTTHYTPSIMSLLYKYFFKVWFILYYRCKNQWSSKDKGNCE